MQYVMFHSDIARNPKDEQFFPSFQNFIINRENLIKIRRAGFGRLLIKSGGLESLVPVMGDYTVFCLLNAKAILSCCRRKIPF